MARVSQQKFLAQLQSGKLIPAILLLGDEPYLRDACRAELIEKFVPEGSRMWGVSRFSADRGEIQQAIDAAQMLPMLAQQQVIFIEDLDRVEKLGEKNRQAVVDVVEAYLKNPSSFTVLVLEANKLDERMKLGKLLVERALVVEVGLGDDPEARLATATTLAETFAREENVKLENGVAEDLAEFVGGDLMRLRTEIRKLATYAAERKLIRRKDVSTLVISEKTSTAWDLADMLASRQAGPAMEFLERILRQGEEPVMILGALTWTYRKLVEAADAKGISNGYQAARALGMPPAKAEMALRSARKIGKPRLLQGLQALQRADSLLKGGADDPRTAMEFLIVELTGATARAAAG
jgi:DNA polymerase III subunit delta